LFVCLLQQRRLDRSGKKKMKEAGRREAVLCNKNNNRDAANYSSWRSIDCPNNNNSSNNKKPYRWPLTTLEKVTKLADLKCFEIPTMLAFEVFDFDAGRDNCKVWFLCLDC
jgi:hypothetical protein